MLRLMVYLRVLSSYTFTSVTANYTINATFTAVCNLLTLYGVPRSTALPSFNPTYSHVYVGGTGGPNLSNVTSFVVKWDLPNKGLYQFSFQTNNGIPAWWVDLLPKITNTFASSSPSCKISGSGISGLDGDYYVNINGSNFVLVSKSGNYAIYGSNSSTPPTGCGNFKDALVAADIETSVNGTCSMFPNPVDRNSSVTINLSSISIEGAKITITDLSGKVVYDAVLRSTTNSLDFGGKLNSGLYIVKVINGNEQYNAKLIIR